MSQSVSQAVTEYLNSEEVKSLSATTRDQREQALGKLVRAVGPRLRTAHLTKVHIDAAMEEARKGTRVAQVGQSSLNVTRSALRCFVRWCQEVGYIPPHVHPALHLKHVKHDRHAASKKRKPLTADQALELLEIAEQRHPHFRAILALMLYTGMRASEVRSLLWEHIDWEAEEIAFPRSKQKGRFHKVPIPPPLAQELRRWHRWYATRHPEMREEWYVCPARRNGRLPGENSKDPSTWRPFAERPLNPTKMFPHSGIRGDVKAMFQEVGVRDLKGKGMHTVRRTFANLFYEATGDIRAVQEALGHSEQETTEIYMDREAQYIKNKKAMKNWSLKPAQTAGNVIPIRKAG